MFPSQTDRRRCRPEQASSSHLDAPPGVPRPLHPPAPPRRERERDFRAPGPQMASHTIEHPGPASVAAKGHGYGCRWARVRTRGRGTRDEVPLGYGRVPAMDACSSPSSHVSRRSSHRATRQLSGPHTICDSCYGGTLSGIIVHRRTLDRPSCFGRFHQRNLQGSEYPGTLGPATHSHMASSPRRHLHKISTPPSFCLCDFSHSQSILIPASNNT